jgi:hypothetical protein
MERIRYKPTARSKGFKPQQLSTAGIDRMREDTNRMIAAMERQRRAQKAEDEKILRSMEANAAYTQERIKQNNEIELQNLKNEASQRLANIQGEIEQSKLDASATESFINSITSWSQTAAKTAAQRTADMIRDQETLGLSTPIQNISLEQMDGYNAATAAQVNGAIKLDSDILADNVLSNGRPDQLFKAYASNHGHTGYAARANDNKVAEQLYIKAITKRRGDAEKVYTTADGRQFTGMEANSDYDLMLELQQQTRKDVANFMGFTDPLYLSEANKAIDAYDEIQLNGAAKASIEKDKALMDNQAITALSTGTLDGMYMGWDRRTKANDGVFDHDWYENNAIANPDIPLEVAGAPDFDGSGQTYKERRPKRWARGVAKRKAAITKRINDEHAFKVAQEDQFERSNIEQITLGYETAPLEMAVAMRKRRIKLGLGSELSPMVTKIEADALKGKKEVIEHAYAQRKKNNTLDMDLINLLPRDKREQAIKDYNDQEVRKYGPDAVGLKNSLVDVARKETGIQSESETGGPQTYLMTSELQKRFIEILKDVQDPVIAKTKLLEEVAAGKAGADNRFTKVNNVYIKFEVGDEERIPLNVMVDKKLKTFGINIVNRAGVLGTEAEMDAAYTSQTMGNFTPPKAIIRVHETLNIGVPPEERVGLVELFNAYRTTMNQANGTDKPLISDTKQTQALDNLPPNVLKLVMSGVDKGVYEQVNRGKAMMTGNLPVRSSIGGGDPLQPLKNFAPQVSSITFDTGQPGIDIFFEDKNFPSVLPGVVKDIGYQVNDDGSGYGNYLVIESIDPETGEAVDVLYSHLPVKPSQTIGQNIELGEIIGKQGGTGSVQSYDGTISSIDFLTPAPRGSKSMTPYSNYESLRRRIANQLQ